MLVYVGDIVEASEEKDENMATVFDPGKNRNFYTACTEVASSENMIIYMKVYPNKYE